MSEVEQVIPDLGPELSSEDSDVGPVIIEQTPIDIWTQYQRMINVL